MPNHPVDLWAMADLSAPWCLHAVVTFHIAELIESGETRLEALALAAGCDARVLGDVLRHLADRGVFEEPQSGTFALNDAARGLLDPGLRLGLDLGGIGGRMAGAWSTLPDYVKTGRAAYQTRFGLPFWEDLAAHPDIRASFDALMGPQGHGAPDPHVVLHDGWDAVRRVVDVGGGTGVMLAAILQSRPGVRGTLVDLPAAVARSSAVFESAGVADRAAAVGQSFFEALPAGADLYLLCKVINDWPDAEAIAILSRCADAARPAGRIVVMGGVSADARSGRLSIEGVLLGGRNRDVPAFRSLAASAGLEVVAADGQPPSGRFVVECRPV